MDVDDIMITVCMNLTRKKYKSTNTTSSETTGSLLIFTYIPINHPGFTWIISLNEL